MCVRFVEQIVCIKNLGALSMSLNYVTMPETLTESASSLFSDSKINEYIKAISKIKSLTIEQEQELAKKAKRSILTKETSDSELEKCVSLFSSFV